jgi:aminoglycoside phosphotransferase family enzyme/predicted kinase
MSAPPAPLDGLLEPSAYPHRPDSVELRETHISWVMLAGDRAYKIKKPLRLPFLDYGSLARRHELCREEVRLNSRLAPAVYRGVCAIVEAPGGVTVAAEDAAGALEYAVEMRRYDERATLSRRLDAGTAGEPEVLATGRRLAQFHARADRLADPEGTVPALEAMLAENFTTLGSLVVDPVGAQRLADARRFTRSVLKGRRAELVDRARRGLARDGHGDLRAEHVVLERGIEIVDCVEFDPQLRGQDVGLDLAFLVMDLSRRDDRLARALVSAYRAAGGDPGDDDLIGFFSAQRALIRAKVAFVRSGQVSGADSTRRRADAAALLELAERFGWRVRLGRLAIVCGLAASGKSTLADSLAVRAGTAVLSSDRVRKDLLGLGPTERAPERAYGREMNRRTYAALGRRAAELLAAGERVVIDATFRFAADRAAFAGALAEPARGAVWIECRTSPDERRRRATRRARQAERISDAGAAVAVRQSDEWEPLAEVPTARRVAVSTDGQPVAVVAALAQALDARLAGAAGFVRGVTSTG